MESDAHSVRVALTAAAPPPPPFAHLSALLPKDPQHVHRESPNEQVEDSGHDELFGRHSKLYQRRKEVEAELKQEFSLPEEANAVLRELRSRRSTPLGCPPPVPKPRMGKAKLPPIPKPSEQHRQPRWGIADGPGNIPEQKEDHVEPPWWKLEQETLARRSSERRAPPEHLEPASGQIAEDFIVLDRTLQKRPQSWRMGRPEVLNRQGQNDRAARCAELRADLQEGSEGSSEPWRMKAKELEAIAAEHRINHEKRKEAERRRPTGYPAGEAEVAAHPSPENFRELRRREEQRFEEMKQEETRRVALEREESRQRRQEQEEWEQAMRAKFAEEAEQLRKARKAQKETEEQQEKQWREGVQRRQEMKQEELRRLGHEREEARKRRQEQEQWEQAMRRKFAEEAEQLKAARKAQPAGQEQQNEKGCQGAWGRQVDEEAQASRFASEAKARISTPPVARSGPVPAGHRAGVSSQHLPPEQPSPPPRQPRPFAPSPQGRHRSGRLKPNTSSRNVQVSELRASGSVELQAAKSAAMRQLIMLKQNPSKEARHKGFKELLRMWHPDKNPGSPEVATTVFQMIQAERGRVFK